MSDVQSGRCGAWAESGPCVLPAGHNRGRADVPSNHAPTCPPSSQEGDGSSSEWKEPTDDQVLFLHDAAMVLGGRDWPTPAVPVGVQPEPAEEECEWPECGFRCAETSLCAPAVPVVHPEPGGCPGVLNVAGEHFACDWPIGDDGKHSGWAHANREAQAIWADAPLHKTADEDAREGCWIEAAGHRCPDPRAHPEPKGKS